MNIFIYTLIKHKAIELGIQNINQAHVFDLLTSASSWATPIKIDDKVFLIGYLVLRFVKN